MAISQTKLSFFQNIKTEYGSKIESLFSNYKKQNSSLATLSAEQRFYLKCRLNNVSLREFAKVDSVE